jgi:hypothetical protein
VSGGHKELGRDEGARAVRPPISHIRKCPDVGILVRSLGVREPAGDGQRSPAGQQYRYPHHCKNQNEPSHNPSFLPRLPPKIYSSCTTTS